MKGNTTDGVRARLPRAVWAIGATSLLNDASSEMIYPLLPLFLMGTLGAGPAALGLIEGAADATASVLKLLSGRWSDRTGQRKPFVVAGYFVASAARPLIAAATGIGQVMAVRVIDRIGKGLRSSPRDALLADVTPPAAHGRAFGLHEAMDHAGAVIGPLAAALLIGAGLSLRQVFALSAVPAVLACVVVLLAVREKAASAPAVPVTPAPTESGAVAISLGPRFTAAVAASVVFALAGSSDVFLLLRAREVGLPTAGLPLLWALHHAVKAAGSHLGGGISDRIGRRKSLALAWLVYAVLYAAFAGVHTPEVMVALFVVYGLHFALGAGAQKALIAEVAPPGARGHAFGVFHAAVGLAALPASAVFGVLYQRLGPGPAFASGAGLALLAVALLPLSRR